jgi:hypothetical protein
MNKTIRNFTIAGAAGIAMIAAGSLATPTQAHAGGKHIAGAIIGGLVAGAIIGAASRPAYAQPSYGVVYQPTCTWQNQFQGYNGYGQAVYQRVQVCG